MLKNDKWLRKAIRTGLITDGHPKFVQKGVLSYGVSSFGYDVRLGNELKLLCSGVRVNPKVPDETQWCNLALNSAGAFELPPHSFALGCSVEYFRLPKNVTGLVFSKSTYARSGLFCFQTVLEAGWEGQITLEFANVTQMPILLYPNEGCAQVLFLEGESCAKSYADRHGKYQGQTGITLSKVSEHD